jgi:hypothetical protein
MSTTHCPTHSCLAPSRQMAPDAAADQSQTIDAPRQPQAYARLFPELPALEIEEELLYALGRQGGACDGAPFAEQGADDARGAAGWPFFGQFVAHDITADRSALVNHADVAALRNARRQKINLEFLYGAGPAGDPYLCLPQSGAPATARSCHPEHNPIRSTN